MNANPLMMLTQVARSGGNPMEMLQMMAQQSNPQAAQLLRMVNGKTPEQTRMMVMNMCHERGTTPQDIAKSLGLPLR